MASPPLELLSSTPWVCWMAASNFWMNVEAVLLTHSCTRVQGPPVALHMSQRISSESWGFSGVAAVSRYTPPLKNPVAPVALQLSVVSHVKLTLKRCRAGVALHCATKWGGGGTRLWLCIWQPHVACIPDKNSRASAKSERGSLPHPLPNA